MSRIEPLRRDQVPGAVAALTAAFVDDPFFRFLAPRDADRRGWCAAVQRANIELALPDGHTYALVGDDDSVWGALCLFAPGRYPPPLLRQIPFIARIVLSPSPLSPPFSHTARGNAYSKVWKRMHPPQPYWYLFNVGLDPARQGRGGGRRLVAHALELARADGAPLYLETQNEANLPFYRACGFEVSAEERPHPDGPPTFGMMHAASRSNG